MVKGRDEDYFTSHLSQMIDKGRLDCPVVQSTAAEVGLTFVKRCSRM